MSAATPPPTGDSKVSKRLPKFSYSPFEGNRCGPQCEGDECGKHVLDLTTVNDNLVDFRCNARGCEYGTILPQGTFRDLLRASGYEPEEFLDLTTSNGGDDQ